MAKLNDLIVTIGAKTRDFDKALGQSIRKMQRFGQTTKKIGADLTKSVSLPILGIGAAAIKSAADLEAMETGFISLTGGAKQAADMMKELNSFAASTPYQIEGIASAAKQLIASGTPVEEVTDRLRFLGDIAATASVPIEDLSSIFAKVNAKGKVELESLNQLAERGIPIFTMLSEATGLPADALGAGAVSVEQFNKVLRSMASEGGFAAGAMERLSQTASGKFSTALDNLKQAGAEMAEGLMPIIKEALDYFTGLAKRVANLSDEKKKLILQIAGFAAALGPVITMLPMLVQGFMALISPIGLTIGALVAIGIAVYQFRNEVAQPIANVINFFVDLYNEVAFVRVIVGYLKATFTNVFVYIKGLVTGIIDLFGNLGTIILAVIKGDFSDIPGLITKTIEDAKNKFIETGQEMGANIVEGIKSELDNRLSYVTAEDVVKNIETGFGLTNVFSGAGGGGEVDTSSYNIQDLLSRQEGTSVDINSGLFTKLGELAAQSFEASTEKAKEAYAKLQEEITARNEAMRQSTEALTQTIAGGFTSLFQGLLNGTQTFGEFMKKTLTDLLIKVAALTAAFALMSIFTGGGGMVAGKSLGQFLGGNLGLGGLIPMASGGIVSSPTPILAGEYSGASTNPEVIAPLDKLKSLLADSGGGNVVVTGKISGRDILLSSERSNFERNRVRGF